MTHLLRRPIVPLLLALHVAGCTTWRPSTVAPRQLIEDEQPGRIRSTLPDSTTLIVTAPTVVSDSIATVREECQTSVVGGRYDCAAVETTSVIALQDVAWVEIPRFSLARTIGLVTAPRCRIFPHGIHRAEQVIGSLDGAARWTALDWLGSAPVDGRISCAHGLGLAT